MRNRKIQLAELIEAPITGEWGNEITDINNQNIVKVIRTTNFTNSGEINYSNITLRDIESQKCEKKRLKYGDIILEKSGGTDLNPVGRVVFFDKDDTNDIYLINNFTTILRVKDKRINSKFLLLFLLYNYKYRGLHKFYNKTTGIQNLQVSNFINQVFVPLPEIEIQNKIIKVLENIKTVIKKQKEQLELLENLKKSQFFELFGDPIKNEKGWEKVKLEKICDVRDGTHDSPKYILEGYPLVTSKNIINDSISFENVNYISETDYQNINKRSRVEYGDILMPMIGTIGKPIIVKIEDRFAIKNLALIKFYEGTKVLNIYVKSLLESNFLEIEIQKNKRGGTQKFIALKDIRNLKIPLPPLELQNKFATKIEAIQKLKFEIEKSLKETENLYNSLMQKFFSNK